MSGPNQPHNCTEHFPGAESRSILAAVRGVGDSWGTEVPETGDRLEFVLPVTAGLRIGTAHLRVNVPAGGGRVDWEVIAEQWRLHWQAVVILVLGAIGGLAGAMWPFFPQLLPLAALGVVLAVAGWLLVSGRVQYHGVEQFWLDVREELDADPRA